MLRKHTTKLKRTVSGILALTMTASVMPSINVFADVQAGSSKTYVGDGYSIRYDVTSVWDGKYEAVYNFRGELLNEVNDPVNMGTYNYANPSDKYYHGKLDVAPYSDEFIYGVLYEPKGWCNIPGVKIDFQARSKNLSNYEHSTEAKEYRNRIEEILYG